MSATPADTGSGSGSGNGSDEGAGRAGPDQPRAPAAATSAPRARARRSGPAFWRMNPTQAAVGLAALGIFFWGSVAALVGYRLERESSRRACARSAVSMAPRLRAPRFHYVPRPLDRGGYVTPAPAWAPYPRPEVLGLAHEPPRTLLVRTSHH